MKLGKAFSDSVMIEQKVTNRIGKEPGESWWLGKGRALLFTSGFLVAFFILVWRLFELTVIQGHRYRLLADTNRTRELIRHAPRGILLDRTGKALTVNIPRFRLTKPCENVAPLRQGFEGQAQEESCTQHISREEGEQLSREGLPDGWFLEEEYLRQYPFGDSLAHVVGYLGELSEKELANDYYALRNYFPGSTIGRMGAEAVFEERLRGRDGRELVEVDARGKMVRSLGRQEAIPGEDITLSLDANLSQAVSNAFPKDARGAVVVTKPTTGEILTLYSSPSFSPDAFSFGMSMVQYQLLTEAPATPMFDRAIGGVYPPGSTFKIVTALAALEEKAVTAQTSVEDIGVITIGPFTFPNWYFVQYGRKEGIVDIVRAMQRSNDIFFYKAGEWLGISKLAAWARKVGIGKPLGIELSGEAAGLMPDPSWKNLHFTTPEDQKARNNEWYLGDTYHVAIGQGYLLTTPLQVNFWTNVIANNGKLCRPTIGKVQSPKFKLQNEQCKDLGIKKETIDLITEGMRRACETGGTGWPLFNLQINKPARQASPGDAGGSSNLQIENEEATMSSQLKQSVALPVACKTGTAEFGDPDNRTHAWFTVFAPLPEKYLDGLPHSDNQGLTPVTGEPEISITVLVEGAGEGSNVAAPIAKKILEAWFGR